MRFDSHRPESGGDCRVYCRAFRRAEWWRGVRGQTWSLYSRPPGPIGVHDGAVWSAYRPDQQHARRQEGV